MQHGGAAAVERMRGLHLGLDQLEAVVGQRQRPQERRADRERVDRRADVVPVPGSVSSAVAVPPPTVAARSTHEHRAAGAGELDRGRQPVRAGADDDRVGQPLSRPAGTAGR